MKDAKKYETKIKPLLRKKPKRAAFTPPEDEYDITALVTAVLEGDAAPQQTDKALEAIRGEYVDLNELRASPLKDLVECIGREYPQARKKAERLTDALKGIFSRTYGLSLQYMAEMTKRNLRRHLKELGLDEYAEAVLTLQVFGGHAIPVDQLLVDCLVMDGYIHPGSDVPDVQDRQSRREEVPKETSQEISQEISQETDEEDEEAPSKLSPLRSRPAEGEGRNGRRGIARAVEHRYP